MTLLYGGIFTSGKTKHPRSVK